MQTFGKQTNNPGIFTPFTRATIPHPEGTFESEVERTPLRFPGGIRESEREECGKDQS
jgi:hypothetical protein